METSTNVLVLRSIFLTVTAIGLGIIFYFLFNKIYHYINLQYAKYTVRRIIRTNLRLHIKLMKLNKSLANIVLNATQNLYNIQLAGVRQNNLNVVNSSKKGVRDGVEAYNMVVQNQKELFLTLLHKMYYETPLNEIKTGIYLRDIVKDIEEEIRDQDLKYLLSLNSNLVVFDNDPSYSMFKYQSPNLFESISDTHNIESLLPNYKH